MSSSGTVLFIGLVAGAGALFTLKPSYSEIEILLGEQIYSEIQSAQASDLATGAILFACRSASTECVNIIRSTIPLDVEDQILWQWVTVGAAPNTLNCLGILQQLYCAEFLNEDS